jgi:hypothetical protein
LNPDDAEDSLVRALMEPLPKTGYLIEAVRQMTGHARHRLPEGFTAACAQTTEHFRAIQPPSRHGKRKLLLASLLGLAVAAAFIVPGAARRELKLLLVTEADQLPDHVFIRLDGQQVIRDRVLSRVSPADGETLFGDLTAETTADRWKALAEREPTNPGRQVDAALGCFKGTGSSPVEFIEKAEALDPGNGWYVLMRGLPPSTNSTTDKSVRIDRTLEWLDQAVAIPRFEDPTLQTWRERVGMLPEETFWADIVAGNRFIEREMPDSSYQVGSLNRLMDWLPSDMAPFREPSKMKRLARVWMDLFEHSLRASKTRAELLSSFDSSFSSSPREIEYLLGDGGGTDQARVIQEVAIVCDHVQVWAQVPTFPTSLLAAKSASAPSRDPALTRPGIAAEWAMHERLIGWGSVLLLGLLLLIHLAVLQSNRGYEALARRLGQVLRRSDHLLIFLISLGLPLLLYALATRLPGHGLLTEPLAQEKDPRFLLLAILHGAWILAVPLLALEATRWRLAVRGRALGMAWRGLHLGMVPLAMLLGTLVGATVLPAIPSVWADPKLPLLGLTGGLAIAALWLLVLIIWHFAAPRESFPERLLRLRVALGPVLAALLVTAAGMVALREHERHLVSINRFEKSPRTHGGNPTSADQEFLETWKPKLLEKVRQAREELEALE